MPATPALLASVESLLNRGIASSAKAAAAARRLDNTAVTVDVEGRMRLRLAVTGERLVIAAASQDDAPAHARVSASALALLGLAAAGGDLRAGASAGREGLRIEGDADLANRYRELMLLARPDFEEELSRWVGDGPAHRLSRTARAALGWARRARHTAALNIAEYLTEESRDLVSRSELEEFLAEVDRVRESADRIEARLGRLERRSRSEA